MFSGEPIPAAVEKVATACVDAGFHVHKGTGPGFKELIYHRALCLELRLGLLINFNTRLYRDGVKRIVL